MTIVKQITDAQFPKSISEGLVLVDFWAPWCGPCRMIAPVLDELQAELGERAQIVKLNVDENPMTPAQFQVMGIPTMILFKDGQPLGKITGFYPKEQLKEVMEQYM